LLGLSDCQALYKGNEIFYTRIGHHRYKGGVTVICVNIDQTVFSSIA